MRACYRGASTAWYRTFYEFTVMMNPYGGVDPSHGHNTSEEYLYGGDIIKQQLFQCSDDGLGICRCSASCVG